MRRSCRSVVTLLSCLCAPLFASAQQRADAPPPVTDAPPPAMEVIDDSVQPEVTIRKRGEDVVEEHRVNGQLIKVIVTPAHGVPYTLVDPRGEGVLMRVDTPGAPQISVPMWELGTF